MARSVVDIELPRLRHECPIHKQFCAYTGQERGLCSFCHSSTHDLENHGELPPGRLSPCLCSRCEELFTSITAFDMHQRPAGVCRSPERRGLVLVEQNGWILWGKPGSRPEDL